MLIIDFLALISIDDGGAEGNNDIKQENQVD